jgi:hypothetical protein
MFPAITCFGRQDVTNILNVPSFYCMSDVYFGQYRILVRKPEGKRPLARPRSSWKDNITMDLQDVGCGGMERIHLAQDKERWWALVSEVIKIWVP